MKPVNLILAIFLGLVLSGCASKTQTANPVPPIQEHTAKNPISVTLYTGNQKPEKPYVVLGHETVSKYNRVGIKRQEANLKDSIRHLAAKKGGDAVIEITNHADSISYTVISYKNMPVDTSKIDKV